MANFTQISELFYIGAAADVKPTGVPRGCKCYAYDTKDWFITKDDGSNWLDYSDPSLAAIKAVTDLLPDGGALTSKANEGTIVAVGILVSAIKAVTDALPDDGALSTMDGLIDAIKAQTDKTLGEMEAQGNESHDWQSGAGSSGETGADLCSLGADGVHKRLLSILVNLSYLTNTATITVKMFTQINGSERKVYSKNFTKGTDPDGCWIVNQQVGIHRAIRVEVQSDNALDNGKRIDFDFMTELM